MNINGTYHLEHLTTRKGIETIEDRQMQEVVIAGSQCHFEDAVGCVWDTNFILVDDNHVTMTTTADQSHASMDFPLADESGRATMDAVTYKTTLRVSKKDNQVMMSGQIRLGDEVVVMTFRKIA